MSSGLPELGKNFTESSVGSMHQKKIKKQTQEIEFSSRRLFFGELIMEQK
jgi:hypothetical protein